MLPSDWDSSERPIPRHFVGFYVTVKTEIGIQQTLNLPASGGRGVVKWQWESSDGKVPDSEILHCAIEGLETLVGHFLGSFLLHVMNRIFIIMVELDSSFLENIRITWLHRGKKGNDISGRYVLIDLWLVTKNSLQRESL